MHETVDRIRCCWYMACNLTTYTSDKVGDSRVRECSYIWRL